MDPEIVKKVEDAIKVIGEKIGAGAEHFWPLLVYQQKIEAITILSIWILLLFLASIVTLGFRPQQNDKKDLTERFFLWALASVSLWISTIDIIIITSFRLATKLFNPEVAAIKQILEEL